MIIALKIIAGLLAYFAFPIGVATLESISYKDHSIFWSEFVDIFKFYFIFTAIMAVIIGSVFFIAM
ncbi:hypothetical protein [Streptomyces sp. ID01-9D]|uniref:hypothetical protein n=1 Tax=Streptomyces sp. ID01-9D TaxID=3028659 RepID=UPI0029C381C2|nr:hypothetical protein [Streptomyces sp. ID01-9D]MDX5578365.1 hypothetical protein [Streptomyces sp. ID01-9D]